jgi:tetratricopeptide (TPR) repeat protein
MTIDLTMATDKVKRPFWLALNPFHGELKARPLSAEEALNKASDHHGLVQRHGARRVASFYEESLLPALKTQPANYLASKTCYEMACWITAHRASNEPDARLVRRIVQLIAELPQAHFSKDPKADVQERKRIKRFLISQLVNGARLMQERGQADDAAAAYEALDQFGYLSKPARQAYAHHLWKTGDRGHAATILYLRYLDDNRWSDADPVAKKIHEFVSEQLAITEESSREELKRRLVLNQMVLCSPHAPARASRHVGLGYLRLNQANRALFYLRRTHSLNGDDGGFTAFYFARALFETGAFEEAASEFEQAAQGGYSRSRIASWQGIAYAKARQWDKAAQTFRVAEEALGEASDGEFYLQWGRASFLMDDVTDAEIRFRKSLARDSAGWQAAYSLAICLEQTGRRAEAIKLLAETSSHAPAAGPVAYLLGRLLRAAGNLPEALPHLSRAIAISPKDPQYALALGLALDEAGDPQALIYLEQAAKQKAGGAEVLRRLALGYFAQKAPERARHWLDLLVQRKGDAEALIRFWARDLASRATEAFNACLYDISVKMWERAARILIEDQSLRERLAMALLCAGAARLKDGRGSDHWQLIQRAHDLTPGTESRFFYGIFQLVHGQFQAAMGLFAGVAEQEPQRREYQFFRSLAAYFGGDATALETLSEFVGIAGAPDINVFLAFLQIQLAAMRGDYETAAEHIKEWAKDRAAVEAIGLPRHQINAFAALCMVRGTRRRKDKVVRFFEELNERFGDGYWRLALVQSKHLIVTADGIARAENADAAKLEECHADYKQLLEECAGDDRRQALQSHGELLRFTICYYISKGDIGGAIDALAQLRQLPQSLPAEIEILGNLLEDRMRQPSHEKAFLLCDRDPEAAAAIWRELLKRNPDDLIALHHLACHAWSRAYDKAIAERYDDSIPFWQEGLNWFNQLYDRPDYWEQLRDKGRALGKSAAHPFDQAQFDAWRNEAIFQLAHTVLDLIFHVMAGYDPSRSSKQVDPRIKTCKGLITAIHRASLNFAMKEKLSDALAGRYLDPDATNLPDFDASVRRAETVLDIDEENSKARCFLLRATAHHVNVKIKEGSKDYTGLLNKLDRLAAQAEWLDKRRAQMSPEKRSAVTADLIAYYDEIGNIKDDEGRAEIRASRQLEDRIERAARNQNRYEVLSLFDQMERIQENLRACFKQSDAAFEKSLRLESVNLVARQLIDNHKEQYPAIDSNIASIRQLRR